MENKKPDVTAIDVIEYWRKHGQFPPVEGPIWNSKLYNPQHGFGLIASKVGRMNQRCTTGQEGEEDNGIINL